MPDVYSIVTERVLNQLSWGNIPWHCPWKESFNGAISYATGKPYSLLNQILLGAMPGEYLTFNQAIAVGGSVRKGEKSKVIVFWKMLEEVDEDTGEVKTIPYLKYINVFNISQCEHIAPRWAVTVMRDEGTDLAPDEDADALIDSYVSRSHVKLDIVESNHAYYSPSEDTVVIPKLSQYTELAEYYSTAFHELAHSTGHSTRLNRITQKAAFGSDVYSKEELCAEIASSFLLSICGLETPSSIRNNTAYINNWYKALQDDKRLIVTAASLAEKAVHYILGDKEESNDGN